MSWKEPERRASQAGNTLAQYLLVAGGMNRPTPANRQPGRRPSSPRKMKLLKTVAALASVGLLGCLVFMGFMEFGALRKTSGILLGLLACVALLAAALFYAFLEIGAGSAAEDEIRPAPESSTLTFPPEPRFTTRSSALDRAEG
jgi:hypothetical protein